MCVKLVHVHQPSDLKYEGHDPPHVERGKEKEEEESKSREPMESLVPCPRRVISLYPLGDASVDNYVGQMGDVFRPDTRIFDASQKERGKPNDKSYCATKNA